MKRTTYARHLAVRSLETTRKLLILFLCLSLAGCGEIRKLESPGPRPGLVQHQHPALVPVPGGRLGAMVNPMGGNLFVPRLDSTTPTTLGIAEEIFSAYNSASREWRAHHEMTFDGSRFVDPSGAVHLGLDLLADGSPIPGTKWGKVDSTTLRADGGLRYVFGSAGELTEKHGAHQACPKIRYERSATELRIRQVGCSPRRGDLNEVLLYTLALDEARVVSLTDRAGQTTTYSYDAMGRLTSVRGAADGASNRPGVRYEYDPMSGLLTAITSSDGERVEYDYYSPTPFEEERLQVVTQIGAGDPQYRFTYYGEENPGSYKTLFSNPLGEVSRFYFDEQRRLSEVEFAEVQERERFTYDEASGSSLRPASHIAANGSETRFTYDRDDIATRTDPSGNIVTVSYERDANNPDAPFHTPLARVEDSLGLVASRAYLLPYFQLGEVANGEGEATVFEWGEGSEFTQLESITFPGGGIQRFEAYNPLGQPTRISHGTSGGFLETQVFDLVGNVTEGSGSSTPEWGGVQTRSYDADRNPVVVTVAGQDGSGNITTRSDTRVSYRSDGQVLCVDRAPAGIGDGADHCFSYDALGRPTTRTERVDGQWQHEVYEYDRLGRRISSERANGMRIEREFDQRGRLVAKRALRNGILEGELLHTYVNGARVATYDSVVDGTTSYAHDFAGRLETIVYAGGETLTYEYDLRSRITAEIYRQSDASLVKRVRHEYDLADRRIRTFDDDELVLEYTVVDGRLEKVWTGNDLERSFSYDPDHGFKTGSVTRDLASGGETIEVTTFSHELTTDPVAWKVASTTIATGVVAGVTETWESRESYEIGPGTDPAIPGTNVGKRIIASDDGEHFRRYAWDEFSNRVDHDLESFDFNPEGNRLNAANVLAADGQEVALRYAYDASGFAVERNGEPLTWNAMGLLTSHASTSFEWDMQGRLRSMQDGQSSRHWERWGGRIEVDDQGFLVALDLGEVALGLGEDAQRIYRHVDYRGNVQFVSNDAGEIITLIEYLPFGVGFVHGVDSAVNFVGRFEVGDGLMIVGARILDTAVGRFLSPDPVFSLSNQFSYTFGNPIWFDDRSGRHPETNGGLSAGTVQAILVAIAAGGFITAVAGFALLIAGSSGAAAFYFAFGGVGLAGIGFIGTLTGGGGGISSGGGGGRGGCGCTKQLELGPADAESNTGEVEESTEPVGAEAPGSGEGSGAAIGMRGAGLGGGSVGGAGGAIAPACGLLGLEILPLVCFALGRRRRKQ